MSKRRLANIAQLQLPFFSSMKYTFFTRRNENGHLKIFFLHVYSFYIYYFLIYNNFVFR